MKNAIAIALETCAERVFLFGDYTIAGTKRTCGQWCEQFVFAGFALSAVNNVCAACTSP
jgi:hypothetical protein